LAYPHGLTISRKIVPNVPCAGTVFFYLRPTAMPVGLADINKKKIVLRAVLPAVDL